MNIRKKHIVIALAEDHSGQELIFETSPLSQDENHDDGVMGGCTPKSPNQKPVDGNLNNNGNNF